MTRGCKREARAQCSGWRRRAAFASHEAGMLTGLALGLGGPAGMGMGMMMGGGLAVVVVGTAQQKGGEGRGR